MGAVYQARTVPTLLKLLLIFEKATVRPGNLVAPFFCLLNLRLSPKGEPNSPPQNIECPPSSPERIAMAGRSNNEFRTAEVIFHLPIQAWRAAAHWHRLRSLASEYFPLPRGCARRYWEQISWPSGKPGSYSWHHDPHH